MQPALLHSGSTAAARALRCVCARALRQKHAPAPAPASTAGLPWLRLWLPLVSPHQPVPPRCGCVWRRGRLLAAAPRRAAPPLCLHFSPAAATPVCPVCRRPLTLPLAPCAHDPLPGRLRPRAAGAHRPGLAPAYPSAHGAAGGHGRRLGSLWHRAALPQPGARATGTGWRSRARAALRRAVLHACRRACARGAQRPTRRLDPPFLLLLLLPGSPFLLQLMRSPAVAPAVAAVYATGELGIAVLVPLVAHTPGGEPREGACLPAFPPPCLRR